MSKTDRADQPEAPTNVRVVMVDGTVIPVQTVFTGYTEHEHIARWEVIDLPAGEVERVQVDMLPARSNITIPRRD